MTKKKYLPSKGLADAENAKVWWDIAQRFTDNDLNVVKIEEFGEVDSVARKKASPKISYLTSRASEGMRIRLGLSEKRGDAIYGAVVRRKTGVYEWQPNTRWPATGELWERSDFNGVVPKKVRQRREAAQQVLPITEGPAQASETAPPVVEKVDNGVKILTRDGNTLVLSADGKIIIAEVKTEANL